MMNLANRTEELISILRGRYHMLIYSNNNEIFCTGGKLMDLPVQAWILPELSTVRFIVGLIGEKGGCLLIGDVNYMDITPLNVAIDAVMERFIGVIKN